MVLTVPVRMGDRQPGHSRRTVLRAALGGAVAAVALGGCEPAKPEARPTPDPLAPFYRDTAALMATYDAVIAAQPALAQRLGPMRDAHRAHLAALARELGPAVPTTAGASAPPAGAGASAPPAGAGASAPPAGADAFDTLHRAEQEGAAAATQACLAAPTYRAALLGSIAACRAGHVRMLERPGGPA
jgi:hypothetical protein